MPGAGDTLSEEPGTTEPGIIPQAPQAAAYIDLRGTTIFGYDEFARRVAEAQAQNARRAGIWATA